MLIQQGLEEIANAPTSEQIAFLLVERARLLDELEAEQGRSLSAFSDGKISEEFQATLDRERQELLEDYEQQRETTRAELEQIKREHEEEINVVMDENQRLEEELNASKKQVGELSIFNLGIIVFPGDRLWMSMGRISIVKKDKFETHTKVNKQVYKLACPSKSSLWNTFQET